VGAEAAEPAVRHPGAVDPTPARPPLSPERRDELPLRWRTPDGWADQALADPLPLLIDHAHLEREAARNALNLMSRAPHGVDTTRWVERLNGVARDEVAHLQMVTREVTARGGELEAGGANPYARELRQLVRVGRQPDELIDRLLVSALIELRSCERFGLLGATDHELAPFYDRLEASEAGHYRLFLQLAGVAADAEAVQRRWHELLDAEGDIARSQPPGPRLHAGMPGERAL
jgi:tRNA-(ms[2]io[6]A)-hydroxylase